MNTLLSILVFSIYIAEAKGLQGCDFRGKFFWRQYRYRLLWFCELQLVGAEKYGFCVGCMQHRLGVWNCISAGDPFGLWAAYPFKKLLLSKNFK